MLCFFVMSLKHCHFLRQGNFSCHFPDDLSCFYICLRFLCLFLKPSHVLAVFLFFLTMSFFVMSLSSFVIYLKPCHFLSLVCQFSGSVFFVMFCHDCHFLATLYIIVLPFCFRLCVGKEGKASKGKERKGRMQRKERKVSKKNDRTWEKKQIKNDLKKHCKKYQMTKQYRLDKRKLCTYSAF